MFLRSAARSARSIPRLRARLGAQPGVRLPPFASTACSPPLSVTWARRMANSRDNSDNNKNSNNSNNNIKDDRDSKNGAKDAKESKESKDPKDSSKPRANRAQTPPHQKPIQRQQPQEQLQPPPSDPPRHPAPPPPSSPSKPASRQSSPIASEASEAPPSSENAAPQQKEPVPDLSKLPDLTQGIPSTLEQELSSAARRAAAAATDAPDAGAHEPATSEAGSAGGGGGRRPKGELPASAYISSSDRRRQRFANLMFALGGVSILAATVYLGRDWDAIEAAKHPDAPNGWGLGPWWARARARLGETLNYYQEPEFEKLLPEDNPENPQFMRPYTLILSLEDNLVHTEWSREHGWRLAKRPGLDYFLKYLSQYYELVMWTNLAFTYGDPLYRKLDPYHFMQWPLYREATKYKDGEIVKDLSYLNRDLKKVMIIETDPRAVRNQPENAIILPKWNGDPDDTALVDLIPFLEFIYTMQYHDVRKVLKSFEGKHIPTEFARREALSRAEFAKQSNHGGQRKGGRGGGGLGWLGGKIGLKPSSMTLMVPVDGEQLPQDTVVAGKMLQDRMREQGIKQYQEIEKWIRENGEATLKAEAEANEAMQKEAMKNMQGSFGGWFGVKAPKAGEESKTTGGEQERDEDGK